MTETQLAMGYFSMWVVKKEPIADDILLGLKEAYLEGYLKGIERGGELHQQRLEAELRKLKNGK